LWFQLTVVVLSGDDTVVLLWASVIAAAVVVVVVVACFCDVDDLSGIDVGVGDSEGLFVVPVVAATVVVVVGFER
jgi:hypothetical protein